jgi:ubiquinone/menaquinone biosynthesis C-methylase UbiE
MPPNAVLSTDQAGQRTIRQRTDSSGRTIATPRGAAESTDSLFERVAWLYAFCRERLFRDDTARMISAIWQNQTPPPGTKIVELGCGPGFYSRKLAQRFPQIVVTGVDRSESQLCWARRRATAQNVNNCVFERVNALALPSEDASFDVLIASRILTVETHLGVVFIGECHPLW